MGRVRKTLPKGGFFEIVNDVYSLVFAIHTGAAKYVMDRTVMVARGSFANYWDSYLGEGLSGRSNEMITRLEGHPISGSDAASAGIGNPHVEGNMEKGAAITNFDRLRFSGSLPGGIPKVRFRFIHVPSLDRATGGIDAKGYEVLPYWSLFNWGSGGSLYARAPAAITGRKYPRRHAVSRPNSNPTSQRLSY